MYTYRIYLDGGNLVIGTYESNVLKGEAKHLPRGLVAVAGNTNTTITLNRVVNNLPTLANIEHPDLRDSNGNVWGANRTAVIAAINSFIQSTGGGNVISVNGQTGTVSLGLQNLVNVTTITPTQGDVLSYNSSGNWVLNSGLQYLLSKVKSSTATQTSLEVDNNYKINIDATQGKTTIVHAGSSVATFGAQKALLPGVTVGTTGNTYDLPATRGTTTGQVPVFNASNNTTSFQAVKVADLSGSTDDLAQGATNLFFTSAEQSKLAGIQSGAEVNVNADWNSSSGDSQILNKPTLSTVATSGSYNDLSNLPSIPAAYTDSNVDNHLNTATATTGQILSWTGSDYDWVLDAAGAPAGTVGQLQYNNSGIFGASSNLFWDISNSRLGIGTSSPVDKVQIETGNISLINGSLKLSRFNEGKINFGIAGDMWGLSSANNVVLQKPGSTFSYNFGTQAGALSFINSANSADFFMLERSGFSTYNSARFKVIEHNNALNNSGEILRISNAISSNSQRGLISIVGDARIYDFSSGSSVERIRLGNDGSAWFNGGNVGIGTTTPAAALNVISGNSDIRLTSGASSVTPTISAINTNASGKAVGLGAGTTYSFFAYDELGSFRIASGPKAKFTSNDIADGTFIDRVTVLGNGNVGIGTTTPAHKLDINGTARFSGNTYLAGDILVANPTGDRYIQASNGTIGFLSSDSTGFNLWTKNSNVGIKSELYINSDLNYNAGIRLRIGSTQTSPSGYSYELSFNPRVNHVPTNVAIRTLDSSYGGSSTIPGPIYIFGGQNTTTGTYGHVILQSDFTASRGNVGIGTTTPSEKLHVVGNVVVEGAGISNMFIGSSTTGDSITTGQNIVALGDSAMRTATADSSYVVAVGTQSGREGGHSHGTSIGFSAGYKGAQSSAYVGSTAGFWAGGQRNVGVGYRAGGGNSGTTQNLVGNVSIGYEAGAVLQTAATAVGYLALTALTTGTENTAIGYQAASTVTTAGGGTFIGHQAGQNRNRGGEVAVGRNALQNAGNGFYQTAVGYNAGQSGMGSYDIAIGWYAGAGAASGGFNIKIGETAGRFHTGTGCIIIGGSSLLTGTSSNVIAIGGGISAGSNTISIGHQSGNSNSTSSIFIGPQAGQNETGSNKLYIENSNSATPLIYGEFDTDLVRINGSFEVTSTTTSAGLYASNQTELRLYELTANGTNYIALKAAGTLAGNTTYTLPTADGSAGQTLTTDASGNMSWAYPKSPVKSEAGTAYTLVLADAGKYIRMTATTAITITIPQDIFAVGDEFFFEQNNTGQVTVAAGTGVTLRNTAAFLAKTAERYAIIGLKCVASNEFILTGERELV